MDNYHNYTYNGLAKFLHWVIALLIVINYAMGLTLDNTRWYEIHKQIGLTILLLVFLRIIWRVISKYPAKLDSVSNCEQLAAKSGQILLYILMLAIPFSGIIMTQIHNRPLNLLGIATLPILIGAQPHAVGHFILEWHLWLAHTIIFIAFVHALIALVHHYMIKDRLLLRMLPDRCNKNS
ncbi:MAG: hypothetical protein QG673_1237 [Pseudomonadota bacterium]|nr:hypothetical protein [Pseudomonadota bacterium]